MHKCPKCETVLLPGGNHCSCGWRTSGHGRNYYQPPTTKIADKEIAANALEELKKKLR